MQRLTQAEMRYLKRNYRDYDVMIEIINDTSDAMLYRIFDKCMYSYECVQLNESAFPLMEVCDNVIERNFGEFYSHEVD